MKMCYCIHLLHWQVTLEKQFTPFIIKKLEKLMQNLNWKKEFLNDPFSKFMEQLLNLNNELEKKYQIVFLQLYIKMIEYIMKKKLSESPIFFCSSVDDPNEDQRKKI